MEANKTILQMKYARIILRLAEIMNVSNEEAMDIFYNSRTFSLMEQGVADMHCLSDWYLADEIAHEAGHPHWSAGFTCG